MKKTFRFTLFEDNHKDIIELIERCPRVLRNELIVLALRTLLENKLNLMVSKDTKANDQVKDKLPEETGQSGGIDITKIF